MPEKLNNPTIIFWAMAPTGSGISGSDRIFIEFAKRWSKKVAITVYVSSAGVEMCRKLGITDQVIFKLLKSTSQLFIVDYLWKILISVYTSLRLNITSSTVIYSTSEFWMDSLPALILKLKFPSKITWVAAWYQTAPNPITGFSSGRYRLSALWYWLAQLPIKPFIRKFADKVLVNNQLETKMFKNSIVVLGAVNISEIQVWRANHLDGKKTYAGVFQGRFHPQKGVVEVIDIWKLVVNKMPDAKLAMIGDGPLMSAVKERVNELHLESNIDLLGYVFDGEKKYKVFSQSKVVLHPALFDSGGMASAEAMAFGIPCVGFDLPAYEDYYPQGMVKVNAGDKTEFANAILNLLQNNKDRDTLGKQAEHMIQTNWSWDKRADQIYSAITTKK